MRPQSLNFFFKSASMIKGVGSKTKDNLKKLFKKIQIEDVYFKDILFHLPHGLIKREVEPNLLLCPENKEIMASLEVIKIEEKRIGSKSIVNILCNNKTGFLTLVFFNIFKDYIKKNFAVGKKLAVAGRFERFRNKAQIIHPDYVTASISEIPENEPIYHLTAGISNKTFNRFVNNIIFNLPNLEEWCDKEFLKKNNFSSFTDSLKKIHQFSDIEDLNIFSNHRKRLAYDEILANQLALYISRKSLTKQSGIKIETDNRYIKELLKTLNFKLTDGQKKILREIVNDLKSNNRMFRLLQGDVGSGKTIVAIAAILETVQAGFQACFMLPTEILAKQQYEVIKEILSHDFFKNNDVSSCLLTGSIKQMEKQKICSDILSNKYQIIIGTHALFQEKVNFKQLALVVIDEQHRFGVKQRMELAQKGKKTHVLLMSATPIPRTLSMTLYGDLEISSLIEKPVGRKIINTKIISLNRIDEITDGIKRAIEKDNQVYWVCPLIKAPGLIGEEFDENASAEERYKNLKKLFGSKITLVHGQMKNKDKDEAIKKFKRGEAKILVATTVIEVGVNIPEATIIVIEQAEKFGLAQLHQLRGRVGRSNKESSCILLYSDKISEAGKRRLKILRETDDGFKIAEEDLAMRGFGDLMGTKQSGFPDFIFAVLPDHKELLFTARDDVKIIMNSDSELKSERGQALRTLLYLFEYDKQIKNIEV